MPDALELDPSTTALVLVDLMDRIVGLPLAPRSGADVVATAHRLAGEFRAAGAAVVLIRVERPNVDEQPPGSDLVAGLVSDGDVVVVKRSIGGFYGTGLHERLRELGVSTLVFGGIATNLGVESTARAASDLGYDVVFVSDAMTALTAPEHDAAVGLNLPRFGPVVPAGAVRLTAAP
ncbi:isochorismatase family protein [Jiangella rhizosphaerae]|uniref:Isochorismatase family protein n=1 Tax=Jiangella rhizosphaerae TaxID=2293569 RepID=A0A418KFW4_9ACTN|nr:isochorismatase family protein [Jiangella rhizosphaerae]RIQ10835.1 isochorismatase family protein [Jiangella rhizosphaerae]